MYDAYPYEASRYTVRVRMDGSENYVPEPVQESMEDNAWVGEAYTIDLAEYFIDEDDDILTYRVTIDGENPVKAPQQYSYIPTTEGGTITTDPSGTTSAVKGQKVTLVVSPDSGQAIKSLVS